MDDGGRLGRSSSVRWFAFAAVILTAASVAGARSLSWLLLSGRVSVVAYVPSPSAPRQAVDAGPGVDTTPTGSIPSSAVVIRIR